MLYPALCPAGLEAQTLQQSWGYGHVKANGRSFLSDDDFVCTRPCQVSFFGMELEPIVEGRAGPLAVLTTCELLRILGDVVFERQQPLYPHPAQHVQNTIG